ncbi:MAG TPA: helix-turn-helix domain-containing protein [Bacteroidales bacterium]|nr:helix-turn-helix domain-containing protein [Bacteroidales bacterium]
MQKSYYAIIPANVRYDDGLTDGAKLLYGEITALSNELGYCWAGNSYFSNLYKKDKSTISRWIRQLESRGYIKRTVNYKDDSKEIKNRYMQICTHPIGKNEHTPIGKNERDNNTSFNNTKEYIYTLFSFWNEQGIIKHRKMNQQMKSHINARLKDYSVDELKKAISNYSTILKSDDYYWTHKWSLQDFMKPNNVVRFVDDADPFNNFKSSKSKNNATRRVADF